MNQTQASAAEDFIDRFAPEGFDWEELVRTYPIPALLLAAAGGFILGRSRGEVVLGALGTFAAAQVSQQVNQLLGEEVL